MKRIAGEYEGDGLRTIWVGFQDKKDRLLTYSQKLGIGPVGYDSDNKVAASYGISYGAGVLFIDSGGTVRTRVAKGFNEDELRGYIDGILNKSTASDGRP